MNILSGIEKYRHEFCRHGLIIRHADREFIPDGVHDITTKLNEAGKINAQILGKSLKPFKIIKCFSSPVERCIQTANNILDGYSSDVTVTISNILGEPGPFVVNCEVAKEHFIKLGTKQVVEKQISNQQLSGIRPTSEGNRILLNFILSEIVSYQENNLVLFITHDAILAPFINYLTGEKFGESNWIDFLDGLYLGQKQSQLYAVRKSETFQID